MNNGDELSTLVVDAANLLRQTEERALSNLVGKLLPMNSNLLQFGGLVVLKKTGVTSFIEWHLELRLNGTTTELSDIMDADEFIIMGPQRVQEALYKNIMERVEKEIAFIVQAEFHKFKTPKFFNDLP